MPRTVPDLPSLPELEALPPERADAAENRHAILSAARALLRERALQAITMTDLAASAGVGQGTLYRRFENKAMLAKALLLEQLVILDGELHARNAEGEAAQTLLRGFVGDLVELVTRQADLVAAIIMKENMHADWWLHTPTGRWLAGVCASLYEAIVAGGDGEEFASFVLPAVMALGPADSAAQIAQARGRIARLLDALLP